MPAGSNEPDGILSYQRHDEEAVIDQGRTSNVVNIHYEKEELEGHRTLYVGVRMPLVRQSHRHHRAHSQKHRKREREKDALPAEHGYHYTPSQRVQFILGTEEDEQHVPHDLFTELDEICVKEGEDAEWKETARVLRPGDSGNGRWGAGSTPRDLPGPTDPWETALLEGPSTDIPVSLPVQCTEDVGTGDGQRCPESRQKHPGALTSSTPHLEGSACPMGQPWATKRLPPSPGHGAGAAGPGSSEGDEGEAPARRRTWILPVPWEGGRAPCSPREMETPNPGPGGSLPNLLDLYEAPEALEREEAPRDVALVEIRGPVKSCWTPGWVLEEGTLSPSAEAAPGCELCQEIPPSEAAAHTEYLSHLLLHLE